MKRTVYLPDHLAERLSEYLAEHPGESLSSIVQESLAVKLAHKDVSQLLTLAALSKKRPVTGQNELRTMICRLAEPNLETSGTGCRASNWTFLRQRHIRVSLSNRFSF